MLLIFIGVAGLACMAMTEKAPEYSAIFYILYILVILALIIYQGGRVYYFGVSDKALIVRNVIYRWYYQEILFTDIKSIRIDADSKRPRSQSPYYLMVFYEGLARGRFYGGTLGGKQWSLLAAALEKHQIRVINPYPYIPFRDML